MAQNLKYGVAIMIPDPPAGELRRIQKDCNLPPWQPSFDLHITLIPPFNTRTSHEELLAALDRAVLRSPFSVRITGVDRFDNAESVIYARIWRTDMLRRLYDDLAVATTTFRGATRRDFIPHVTLANPASRQTVDGYMKCTAGKVGEYDFICDRFTLLRLDEQARVWKPVHEFPFTF